MMQCSISIRASSLECESCGRREKRMLGSDYTCMSCGVIDSNVMVVDEMSDQRKQWEHSEADMNTAVHADRQHSFAVAPRCGRPPRPTADKRVLKVAKKASHTFSIDTDHIPLEATSLYMATTPTTCQHHISKARVIACTMIVAHRRTLQDIQDVAMAFTLKPKSVSCEIEAVQARVRLGEKSLGDNYGYLFRFIGERRSSLLVKEALDQLVYCMQGRASRQAFEGPAWGVRSLADDMMQHVQDRRLIGGDSLEILARALIVVSCELYGLPVSPIPADFISAAMLQSHRATWRAAVPLWPASHGTREFEQHVATKLRLVRGRDSFVPALAPPSKLTQSKRVTRSLATELLRGRGLANTSISAGATHLCVVAAAGTPSVQAHVAAHGVGPLLDVCLALVGRTPLPHAFSGLGALVQGGAGHRRELEIAQKFQTPLSPSGASCFIPRQLMCWGTGLPSPPACLVCASDATRFPRCIVIA